MAGDFEDEVRVEGSEGGSEACLGDNVVESFEEWPTDRRGRVLKIAAAWGTTPNYVYKVQKQGCPIDSLDAAMAWRQENSKLGIGYRSQRCASVPTMGHRGRTSGGAERGEKKTRLRSLEASLKEAVAMEERAAEMVKVCLASPETAGQAITAMNVFNKAQANRMEREKGVVELLEAQRKLVTIDFAIDLLKRGWSPLLQRLRSVPRRAAPRANPVDDILAEAVISDEIEEAVKEAERSYAELLEGYA